MEEVAVATEVDIVLFQFRADGNHYYCHRIDGDAGLKNDSD